MSSQIRILIRALCTGVAERTIAIACRAINSQVRILSPVSLFEMIKLTDISKKLSKHLADAIIEMQLLRDIINNNPDILYHDEWIHVLDNQPTIHSNVTIKGHIENCECGFAVDTIGDTNDI